MIPTMRIAAYFGEPLIDATIGQGQARYAAMSIEYVLTFRAAVTFAAAGVVVFVAFALIKSAIRGGKRVVWEILRVTLGLICMGLAGLSGHGNVGPWGAWIGFGGVFALLLAALIVGRSGENNGRSR
jgi:hypothetical protein